MAKAKSKAPVSNAKQLFNLDETKQAFLVLRSLNHKMRQNILSLMDSNKEIKVSDIYRKLKLEQSLTSAYLQILRKARVVTTRRNGQEIYYSIDYKRLADVERGAKLITGSK